jgi:hypothetical protein
MREPRKRQQAAAAARNNVAPVERSTNLMEMPLDEFQGALAELAQQGVDTDALLRQYRAANSPFAAVNRAVEASSAELAAAGRRPVSGSAGLLSRSIDDAGGVRFEPAAGLLGMLAGVGRQIDAPMAAYQELIPAEDMDFEALGTAGVATLGGGAVTRPAGSFGMGGRVSPDIDARVAAARQAVLDNPNDAALFDQYKALRRERDTLGSRPADVPAERMPTADEGFEAYLSRVNPAGARIAETERPNLGMGDMYGMLPRNARKMGERDGVSFYQGPDGATYATAFNPDVGEMDVVGFAMPAGDMTDLAVANEMQGRGIGSELQYLMRSQDPYALSGGLTEAGERTLRGTYDRLRNEGIVAANRDQTVGLLSTAAAETKPQRIARLLREGRQSEVTDDLLGSLTPDENATLFRLYDEGATGMDLPMDEASRLARAGEILPQDAYHSTGATFSEFIPSAVGRHGMGVYTGKNRLDVESFLPRDDATKSFEPGAQTLPLRIPGESAFASEMKWQDALPERWAYGDPRDVQDAIEGYASGADVLSQAGYKGVMQPATDWEGRVVFNPANIRSRFARFDPRLTANANLLAANASPEAGLLSAAAARTPAEQMARRILDMRAAGRAGEVTDEMMAAADPEYMYFNTPLPMDEASRMARAGEIDAYHGTTANFPAFDGRAYASSGFGTHMGDQMAADAILRARRSPYLPKDAPTYVEGSQVLPLRVNAGPMLRVEDTETWNPGATQYAMAWSDDPAAVDAYNRLEKNPDYPKFGTEQEQSSFIQNDLEKSGFGGFVYDNKFEGGGDSYAVFDPSNIRSRFARFDPEFAHLSNLSAANIDPLSGLFGAMAAEEQRRRRNAP